MKYEIRKIDNDKVVYKTDNLKAALNYLTSTSLKLIDTEEENKVLKLRTIVKAK